jgi:hypothetical protein
MNQFEEIRNILLIFVNQKTQINLRYRIYRGYKID